MCTLLTQNNCLVCHTQELHLNFNKISDEGLTALAKAVESGALASLEKLFVPGINPQLKAACSQRGIELV